MAILQGRRTTGITRLVTRQRIECCLCVCVCAHVQDGILFKAGQAVIPADIRADIRKLITSYLGIEGALFEPNYFHWPGTNVHCRARMAQRDTGYTDQS